MFFPADMTAEDIMEFEYEYFRYREMEEGVGQYWEVNADIQFIVDEEVYA